MLLFERCSRRHSNQAVYSKQLPLEEQRLLEWKMAAMKRTSVSCSSDEEASILHEKKRRRNLPSSPAEEKSQSGVRKRKISDSSEELEKVNIKRKGKKRWRRFPSSSEEKSESGVRKRKISDSSEELEKVNIRRKGKKRWRKFLSSSEKSESGGDAHYVDAERSGTSGAQPTSLGVGVSLSIQRLSFYHQIGQGGYGKVLLAADACGGQHLAVKIIRKRHLLREGREQMFVERRVLELASGCAFLTQGYFALQTKELVLLGMEYASGGDLHQLLKREGRLTIPSARFYAAEMVCGVQFLHSKGIIHRDLKPENILVAGTGHIKIADFGLAIENICGDRTATGYAGTPGYIAPEMRSGEEYDAGVDWYSFGVILTKMITGSLKYSPILFDAPGSTAEDIIQKLLHEDPARRLGEHGNICRHPFFERMDWVSLAALNIAPPYLPTPPSIAPSASGNIHLETLEAAEAQKRPIPAEDQELFTGFSFVISTWRTRPQTPS